MYQRNASAVIGCSKNNIYSHALTIHITGGHFMQRATASACEELGFLTLLSLKTHTEYNRKIPLMGLTETATLTHAK